MSFDDYIAPFEQPLWWFQTDHCKEPVLHEDLLLLHGVDLGRAVHLARQVPGAEQFLAGLLELGAQVQELVFGYLHRGRPFKRFVE